MPATLRLALPAVLLWAFGAHAQPAGPGEGWYLGGGIRPVVSPSEESDIGYRHFGGYRFSRHWGVELGYSDLGRGGAGPDAAPAATDRFGFQSSAWTLAGTGVLPLGEAFSLQGRLGWSMASPESTLASSGLGAGMAGLGYSSALPRYRSAMLWGFGGQYDLSSHVGLRVDYNNFGRLDDQNGTRSDLWSINAVVRF